MPYGWQPTPSTYTLPAHQRTRLNVIGIYNPFTQDSLFHTTATTVTADTVIELINDFASHYYARYQSTRQRCRLILDNASIHRAKAVQAKIHRWYSDGIILHFLPPYSPELNRIETLWRKIKYEWLPLHAYESLEMLQHELRHVLDLIGHQYAISFR